MEKSLEDDLSNRPVKKVGAVNKKAPTFTTNRRNSSNAPLEDEDPTEQAEPAFTQVAGSGIKDQPVSQEEDTLGFKPYVQAVGSFLLNKDTKPPFSFSIEGEWGSGKSSFMLQLEQMLNNEGQKTIQFNAWRHDKMESMWAAFAVHFIKKLSADIPLPQRLWRFARLDWSRFDYRRGWFALLSFLVLILIYLIVGTSLLRAALANQEVWLKALFEKELKDSLPSLLALTGGAGFFLVGALILRKIVAILGSPFSIDLKRFIRTPNYQQHGSFIEDFHEDVDRMLNELTKQADRIFIFIDDLDRAEVPKAADLMQGINMMISNSPKLIFIIGMDREKVAAGITVKYKELIPYLLDETYGIGLTESKRAMVGFGYSFLEKFIQLSFKIPVPAKRNIVNFITMLGEDNDLIEAQSAASSPSRIIIQEGPDSELFQETILLVAFVFDYNPRRIKQFINILRLKTHIAYTTGLFLKQPNFYPLTLPRLGKFLAITQRWPYIINDLQDDYSMFDKVDDSQSGVLTNSLVVEKWIKNDAFMEVINAYPDGFLSETDKMDYRLTQLDVRALLETTFLLPPPVTVAQPIAE
ncbi:KAP family P-loop NTPase fold protein [Spirosoma flavum]|uniref:P-loop NTPase fold protein n=1 Tax=Spirosoma flavum TaxID=2048557 RepID=A0ABW6ARU1_9BACT